MIGEDALLLEALALATDGPHIDAGALSDAVVGLPGIADQLADDEALLIV
jgi:hypothetical protein